MRTLKNQALGKVKKVIENNLVIWQQNNSSNETTAKIQAIAEIAFRMPTGSPFVDNEVSGIKDRLTEKIENILKKRYNLELTSSENELFKKLVADPEVKKAFGTIKIGNTEILNINFSNICPTKNDFERF